MIAPGCWAYTPSMTADAEDGEAGPVSESLVTCPARLSIGAEVLATDGLCGDLIRVIVDPAAQAVTHLVVAPAHHVALGRLVPIDLLVTDADQIRLKCTTARFKELEDAEEIQFLAADSDAWGYGSGHVSSWPYYGLGMPLGKASQSNVSDRVPAGEVQVRRGDRVHATDGPIGSVQGLVIDPTDHHVTHVLLQEGHLWGRKQVAIPIRSTSSVGDEIRVELSKDQVQNLPEIKLSSTR